jgi:hypothetical protein
METLQSGQLITAENMNQLVENWITGFYLNRSQCAGTIKMEMPAINLLKELPLDIKVDYKNGFKYITWNHLPDDRLYKLP